MPRNGLIFYSKRYYLEYEADCDLQGCNLRDIAVVIQYGPGASIGSVWQRFGRCQRDLSKTGQCVWLLKAWGGPTRKIQTTHREVRTKFQAQLAKAPVLTKSSDNGDEAGEKWRSFTKELLYLFKRERWCYRQLFMLYFGEHVGYLPTDIVPGASSIAGIIDTDEKCCDLCYYRKREQSLQLKDKQRELPLLPHMERLQNWKAPKKPKPYPASVIDKPRMLKALESVRADVYKMDPELWGIICEEDFCSEVSMISMIESFALTGPCEDALVRWLDHITWGSKEEFGDHFFEKMKEIADAPQDEPTAAADIPTIAEDVNDDDKEDDAEEATETSHYEV